MTSKKYQYWTDSLDKSLSEKGYNWHIFDGGRNATRSELEARESVKALRRTGYYARIICGLTVTGGYFREFSICYRPKNKSNG